MPRPKKPVLEAIEPATPVEQAPEPAVLKTPYYRDMVATIVRTHADGHVDLTVSYDGKTQVPKNRVAPEGVEYR